MTEPVQICTNCKKEVQKSNYTVHSVHCQRNVTLCKTCNEAVPKCQYEQHVKTTHAKAKCPKCNEMLEAKMLSSHQKEDCACRMLTCQYCEVDLKAAEMEKHLDFCGARTERCKGCSKFVQSKHLQFHYDTDHTYLNPKEKENADATGKESEEDECPICLGPVTLPIALECGHVFCMVCVKGIASSTKNCAICRRDINRDMLMDIRFCVEEEVIKNYVNNSKYKKNPRSKSVPGRFGKSGRRYGKTTEDYDDMVSALLTNRTASSSYRYERPSNGHTPRSYRPYCFSSSTYRSTRIPSIDSSANGSSSSSSNDEDECCDSSSSSPMDETPGEEREPSRTPIAPARANHSITRRTTSNFTSSVVQTSTRKRPTSLALATSISGPSTESSSSDSRDIEDEEPQSLTQEEYDRWLAFQLAKSEDDLTPAEFNNRHKNPMRRSQSMPESQVHRSLEPNDTASDQNVEGACALEPDSPNGLPPAVPRKVTTHSSSSATRASVLTKSSSESSASVAASSSNNTGARPKSSTGLRKRVSFKENSPPRKYAPVLLPCEFCNKMVAERDLMRHQTSCDDNETKNPQEYLMSRRSSASSPLTSPTTPLSPSSSYPGILLGPSNSSNGYIAAAAESLASKDIEIPHRASPVRNPSPEQVSSGSSSEAQSPVSPSESPVSSPCGPATKPPASPLRNADTPNKQGLTRSPSSRTKLKLMKQSSAQSPVSTPNGSFSEGYQSGPASRNASISPCNEKSANTSGIGSAASSLNNSPASSASNSPIPVSDDIDKSKTRATSEDSSDYKPNVSYGDKIEPTAPPLPLNQDETPFPQPRKGKLICSAITSWKSLAASRSGSRNSNFSPTSTENCARSKSAPQFMQLSSQSQAEVSDESENKLDHPTELVILPKKSHRAPSPPRSAFKSMKSVASEVSVKTESFTVQQASHPKRQKAFRFDSMPLMNGSAHIKDEASDVCSTKSEDHSEDDSVEYNPFYYCREEDEEVISPTVPTKSISQKNTKETVKTSSLQHESKSLKSTDHESADSSVTVNLRKKKPDISKIKENSPPSKHDMPTTSKIESVSHTSQQSNADSPIELFPCSYCDKMFTKDKMHDHKKACKKVNKKKSDKKRSHDKSPHKQSGSPSVSRKNKKGPAPRPPTENSSNVVELPALGRSNSVRERRSACQYDSDSEGFGGRIERACSIKETSSRFSRMSEDRSYLSRRWMSRDSVYGGGLEASGVYSGSGSLASSSTSLSNLSGGRGWSSHVNMLREDFRSRRASTSLGVSFSSGLYSGISYRERSISRSRPSSLYSSSSYISRLCY